jgi:hypothetical protein
MRSLMRVSTVMWPPQSSCPRRDRACGASLLTPGAHQDTPDATRSRTPSGVRDLQIRPIDAACVSPTHDVTPESTRGFRDRTRPPSKAVRVGAGSTCRFRRSESWSHRQTSSSSITPVRDVRVGAMSLQPRWPGDAAAALAAARRRRRAGTGRYSWCQSRRLARANPRRSRCHQLPHPLGPCRSPSPTI